MRRTKVADMTDQELIVGLRELVGLLLDEIDIIWESEYDDDYYDAFRQHMARKEELVATVVRVANDRYPREAILPRELLRHVLSDPIPSPTEATE